MRGRVAYLDGIRALAITSVLCSHWVRQVVPLGFGGHIGVDIFFVLSGFIITRLLWVSQGGLRERYLGFVWRRVRRLYPALLGLVVVATALAELLPQTLPAGSHPLRSALLAVVQLTWASSAVHASNSTIGQTWSLGIEWLFYLVWPAAVLSWSRRGVGPVSAARLTAVVAAVLYLGSLMLSGRQFYYLPPARFAELLTGAALGLALFDDGVRRRAARPHPIWPPVVVLAVIAGYVAFAPSVAGYGPDIKFVGAPVATLGTAYLLWWGQGELRGPAGQLLTHRWVAGLGGVSYSVYLWHTQPAHFIKHGWLPAVPGAPGLSFSAAVAGLTVVLTAASYYLLERPFLTAHAGPLAPAAEAPAREVAFEELTPE